MRLLITGGCGFIGSAVVRQAIKDRYSVVNIDAMAFAASESKVADYADSPNYVKEVADIRDRESFDAIFSLYQPDEVMHLALAWHETYGLPGVLTNCSNNYRPYHFPEKLIPVVILNAIHGKELPVYVRDWLYVEDHAGSLFLVLKKGKMGRSYNIRGSNESKNISVVNKICDILDELHPKDPPYSDQITFVSDRPGHDLRYAIDTTRIYNGLVWKPLAKLVEGLRLTAMWYLENEAWKKPLLHRMGIGQRLGKE